MAAPNRRGQPSHGIREMRPPASRQVSVRARSTTPAISNGRASRAGSVAPVSHNGLISRAPTPQIIDAKRSERDHEEDVGDTSISVFIRCRGRSDREVQENSGVVVYATDGIVGQNVELSMGPTSLANKRYQFDKVFSPAADQGMIFEEIVTPILDEVLSGLNCTIFAYGQTGTGKTYTMSGDISDTLPLPDAAGIIPRVLHALFAKLGGDDQEIIVKCSFLELYNEELRDLLSPDDTVKLKIFEEPTRSGHNTTRVLGVGESHIPSVTKGIELLRQGSHKRQVAATKCNDLSSRSHTIFTVTVYKTQGEGTDEQLVNAGKLNLVDLAGSENIGRSGAENKRATEAGLINKSLLTLGRVINALVDKSSHIPYRESKLTRLLQDSLGGQTKTCIIATLSPAQVNLEETVSTLDYAFRAKNIRSKPQVNNLISKNMLLKDWAIEIEKLKSELVATRTRNGIHLTPEAYEELTSKSESRRILSEEQRDKLESMEINLRHKTEEIFNLTNANGLAKKDIEDLKQTLDTRTATLEQTRLQLQKTEANLERERVRREAYEATERELTATGTELVSTLGRTTSDIETMHSNIDKRTALQSTNQAVWQSSQALVSDATAKVEKKIEGLYSEQAQIINDLEKEAGEFISRELDKVADIYHQLSEASANMSNAEKDDASLLSRFRESSAVIQQELNLFKASIKQHLCEGLEGFLDQMRSRSQTTLEDVEALKTELASYQSSIKIHHELAYGRLSKDIITQQRELDHLTEQLQAATFELIKANSLMGHRAHQLQSLHSFMRHDREQLKREVIQSIDSFGDQHESRLEFIAADIKDSHEDALQATGDIKDYYFKAIKDWSEDNLALAKVLEEDYSQLEEKIDNMKVERLDDVHYLVEEGAKATLKVVEQQRKQIDSELKDFEVIAGRVKDTTEALESAHTTSFQSVINDSRATYTALEQKLKTATASVSGFGNKTETSAKQLQGILPALDADAELRRTLRDLRQIIGQRKLEEYVSAGNTPPRMRYEYPKSLPRTELTSNDPASSPTKGAVFRDDVSTVEAAAAAAAPPATVPTNINEARPTSSGSASSLRQLDVNVLSNRGALPATTNPSKKVKLSDVPLLPPKVVPAPKRKRIQEPILEEEGMRLLEQQEDLDTKDWLLNGINAPVAGAGNGRATKKPRKTISALEGGSNKRGGGLPVASESAAPPSFSQSVGAGGIGGGRRRLRSQGRGS